MENNPHFIYAAFHLSRRQLQGQFRQSDLTYDSGSLDQLLGEAWTGVQWRPSSGWGIQYLARWESPEMRQAVGSRSIVWGSIDLSKSF